MNVKPAFTAAVFLAVIVIAGCDDAAPVAVQPPSAATTVTSDDGVRISTLAPLLPARTTHVAVDAQGAIYWSQEGSDAGSNLVFAVGDDGVPRATRLSVSSIAAEMGASGEATGTIQSLAAGADGCLYFFFNGGSNRETLACIGRLVPESGNLQIITDTAALHRASSMGAALALARGTLIATHGGQRVWLWLRHSDRSILFRFDAGETDAPPPALELHRPFERVTLRQTTTQPAEAQTLALTADSQKIGAGADGALLLLDVPASMLRRIDPETGVATDLVTLMGLSESLSRPAIDPRSGDGSGLILLFSGDGDLLPPRSEAQAAQSPLVEAAYEPMLLAIDPPALVGKVAARQFKTNERLAAPSMALQQLVHAGDDEWIAYDAGSGSLLRLTFRPLQ